MDNREKGLIPLLFPQL